MNQKKQNKMEQKETAIVPKNIKDLLNSDLVKDRFREMLGKRANAFLVSVINTVNSTPALAACEPNSILSAAATAATLDLPIDPNLGFAYIIPYNKNVKEGKDWRPVKLAQFQIGYKGFKQLAIRSGQFVTIHESDVKAGEIDSVNRLTGEMVFNWIQDETDRALLETIGYVSYFKLSNGFESTFYMSVSDMDLHAKKYSKSFKEGQGLWNDDRLKMALKTVVKLNLSKNAPLSIENLQVALRADQATITENAEYEYIDNPQKRISPHEVAEEKENERIIEFIKTAPDYDTLMMVEFNLKTDDHKEQFNYRVKEFNNASE